MTNENKQIMGIWLDKLHAHIIGTPNNQSDGVFEIKHTIKAEHHHYHGSSEGVLHHKSEQELKQLFNSITHHLEGIGYLFITGPGITQEQLKNYLHQNHNFKNLQISLGKADHLTIPQMIAQVRDHFHNLAI